MPIAVAAFVGPADMRVRRASGLITCVGLSTGACLCLFDPLMAVGGMAHITHGESPDENPNRPGKYASSAIEALIQAMERTGAHRGRLTGTIAGGPEPIAGEDGSVIDLMAPNVFRAVKRELERRGIPIVGVDTGGQEDRSVILDVTLATVTVRGPSGERACWPLGASCQASLQAA